MGGGLSSTFNPSRELHERAAQSQGDGVSKSASEAVLLREQKTALSVLHLQVANDHWVQTSTTSMKISMIASFHVPGLGCPPTAYRIPISSLPAFSRQPLPVFPFPSQTGVLPLRSAVSCTHPPPSAFPINLETVCVCYPRGQ